MKSLTILFAMLFCFQAQAQDIDVDNMDLTQFLDVTVTTASKSEESLRKTPATVRVITESQIKERGYRDLKDIFRDLPGFDVSEELTGEVRTLAMNRGLLGANKLLFLKDGKRLNAITGERFVLGNNIPLFNVKRIEIVYGPGAVHYGADAYAGIVNVISKSFEDYKKDGNMGAVNISYGDPETIDAGVVVGHEFNDKVNSMISYRRFFSKGFDPTGFESFDTYNTLGLGFEQPVNDFEVHWVTNIGEAKVTFYHQNANEPGGQSTSPALFQFDAGYVWNQKQNKITVEHTFEGENWTLDTLIGYEDYEIDPNSVFYYQGPFLQYKYGKNTAMYIEEKLEWRPSKKYKLVSGFKAESVDAFAKGNNLNTPFDRDDLVDSITYPNDTNIPVEFRNQTLNFGVRPYTGAGVYTEANYAPDDVWQFNVGVRYDYNSDYYGVFTPRAGVVYTPDDKFVAKLLYGEAYIKPSRYLAFEHWSAGTFGYFPNPDLEPEELQTIQLNFSYLLTKNLNVSLNSFMNNIKNLIRPENNGGWSSNVNQGEPKSSGFELEFDYQQDNITAYLYYSYLNAEQDGGEDLNKVAQSKVSAGANYKMDQLSFDTRLRWSDEISFLDATATNGIGKIDGHFLVDLSIHYKDLWKDGSLTLFARNLLDEKYEHASPFGEGPEGWLNTKAPQPGRFVGLTVDQKF